MVRLVNEIPHTYYKPKKAKCIINTLSFIVRSQKEANKIIEQVRKKHGIKKEKFLNQESIYLVNLK